MEEHYGSISDLRRLINNRQIFTTIPQSHMQPSHNYDMVNMPPRPRGSSSFNEFIVADSSTTNNAAASAVTGGGGGFEAEAVGGNARWPRQETLTLLEIRSRLDSKFKEANQKGPLWDEVSRIMCEEHGYNRSGKKCREKFENLYKYYKKTKEGKTGRQDGKHYRFFRQLEALYGETNNNISNHSGSASETPNPHPQAQTTFQHYNNNQENNNAQFLHHQDSKVVSDSLSLSGSSDYGTTSSDGSEQVVIDGARGSKKRKGKGRWRAKIKDFIDGQMRKLVEKQEAWLEKIMKAIEKKEQERELREEEWRRQEASRIEKEHKFWANERAWIEARDSALMEALHKVTTGQTDRQTFDLLLPRITSLCHSTTRCVVGNEFVTNNGATTSGDDDNWPENDINNPLTKCNIKNRKDEDDNNNIGSCYYFPNNNSSYCPDQQQQQQNEDHHPINAAAMNDSCFRLLMGDNGDNLWDSYGLKLKAEGEEK